jgi:N-acetylglucosamine repressor
MLTAQIPGKPQLNRKVNRTLILDRIRLNGEISRAELAKETSIRPPTVTAIIRDLLAEGLVVEVGTGDPRGGRAPRILALSCRLPHAIGFELTDTAILAGLSDLKGNLAVSERVAFSPQSPTQTVELLERLAARLFRQVEMPEDDGPFGWERLRGAGLALPGLIDSAEGVVRYSHPLKWENVALRAICEERWGVRTDIINDSSAGSMAAHFFHEQSVQNLVYIVLRFADASNGVVGVGTGLIINGEPYHGEFGVAGEITTPVRHPLVDARGADGQPFAGTAEFVRALQAGVAGARETMDRVARELSVLVLLSINLFDPGRLILECDVPELGVALQQRLRRVLDEHALGHGSGRAELVVAEMGEFGGVKGAVVPALRRFFKLPSWT